LTDISNGVKKCFTPGIDFSYMSSSTVVKGQMHYSWSFGTTAVTYRDGDSVDYINPRIIFDTAGTYPVKLKVTTDKGCVDSFTSIVKLSDPHAKFDYSIDYGGDVYSNPAVSVTNNSYDYGAILTNWNWTYGNGASSALQNPAEHHYDCGGTYSLSLKVTSEVPCYNTTSSVVVIKIKPKAAFSVSTPNYTPNVFSRPTYTFTNGTTANDACPNFQYAWSFGDGGTATTSNPQHTYALAGVYSVKLIVTTNAGCVDSITTSITACPSVTAAFSVTSSTDQCLTGNSFTFANSSTNNAGLPASAMSYVWYFGDGPRLLVQSVY
jgi:PKD repeat protein